MHQKRLAVLVLGFSLTGIVMMGSASATTYTMSGDLMGNINGTPIPPGAVVSGSANDATGAFSVTYSNLPSGVPAELAPYMRQMASFMFAKENGGAKNGWNYMDHTVNAFLGYVRDCPACFADATNPGSIVLNVNMTVKDLATNNFWANVTVTMDGFPGSDPVVGTRQYSEDLFPITPDSDTVEGVTGTGQRTVDTAGGASHEETWNTEVLWVGEHAVPSRLTVVPGTTTAAATSLTVDSTIAVEPLASPGVPTLSEWGIMLAAAVLVWLGMFAVRKRR